MIQCQPPQHSIRQSEYVSMEIFEQEMHDELGNIPESKK